MIALSRVVTFVGSAEVSLVACTTFAFCARLWRMAQRLRVAFVSNAPPLSGVGKPAMEWLKRLRSYDDLAIDHFDLDAAAHEVRRNGEVIRRLSRWSAYEPKPLFWWRAVRAVSAETYDLWHLTNQTLAFAPVRPKVVTVFDLIERTDPQRPLSAVVARFLYRGIPRADGLAATSDFTRREVRRLYGVDPARVVLTQLAAGPQYRPIPDVQQHERFRRLAAAHRLDPAKQYVLSVSSEHPRKNLPTAVKAIALARKRLPGLQFLKVGPAGIAAGRAAFLRSLATEDIEDITTRIEYGGEEELPFLYNLATVLLFPSLSEGFGIPPLEAMQCGCPTIVSNRTSLPEVVGDAGVVLDPFDAQGMADAIVRICTDSGYADLIRERGLREAERFTWERSAATAREAYYRAVGRNVQRETRARGDSQKKPPTRAVGGEEVQRFSITCPPIRAG